MPKPIERMTFETARLMNGCNIFTVLATHILEKELLESSHKITALENHHDNTCPTEQGRLSDLQLSFASAYCISDLEVLLRLQGYLSKATKDSQ